MSKQPAEKLTPAQRDLVAANLGLVGVHMRRVSCRVSPMRDRERDDLFQEGYLGLITAAQRYTPAHHMPFAAFAIPRIHNAVSMALHHRFRTVRVATYRNGQHVPSERSMSDEFVQAIPDRRTSGACAARVRSKAAIEPAVRRLRGPSRKSAAEYAGLVARLLDYVFSEEAYRPSLRQISRDISMWKRPSRSEKQTVTALIRFSSVRYFRRASSIVPRSTRSNRWRLASRFISSSWS